MSLSKARNKARMKIVRHKKQLLSSLTSNIVQPDALQSTGSPLTEGSNSNLPPELDASGEIIPEYW